MLNKEETLRLASFLDATKADLKKDKDLYAYEYRVDALLWLAEKLKETNEELKIANIYSATVAKELDALQRKHAELDKMLAQCMQEREVLRKACENLGDELQNLEGDLNDAQLRIDQLEGKG